MNPGRHLLATWIVTAGIAGSVLGQGNVNLNNNFVPPGQTQKAYILDADGLPLSKAYGRVEVLNTFGEVFRSGGLAFDGIFALGVTDIPGTTPGANATIIIRAWDVRFGDSFDTALFRHADFVSLVGLGGGAIPPPQLSSIGDFTGLGFWTDSVPFPPSDVAIAFTTEVSFGIQCTGLHWRHYLLWSSPDLFHWTPASDLQIPSFGEITNQRYRVARWTLPRPASNLFFRVAPYFYIG